MNARKGSEDSIGLERWSDFHIVFPLCTTTLHLPVSSSLAPRRIGRGLKSKSMRFPIGPQSSCEVGFGVDLTNILHAKVDLNPEFESCPDGSHRVTSGPQSSQVKLTVSGCSCFKDSNFRRNKSTEITIKKFSLRGNRRMKSATMISNAGSG